MRLLFSCQPSIANLDEFRVLQEAPIVVSRPFFLRIWKARAANAAFSRQHKSPIVPPEFHLKLGFAACLQRGGIVSGARPSATTWGHSTNPECRPVTTWSHSVNSEHYPAATFGHSADSECRPATTLGHSENSECRPVATWSHSANTEGHPVVTFCHSANAEGHFSITFRH